MYLAAYLPDNTFIAKTLTAGEVLRAFHHDEPYLFLGAAFTTIAIVSAALCLLRRRFDGLLICLAFFAWLYGQRLWLESEILSISLPNNEFFHRLQVAVNYLVPIPGFFFFQAAGFLGRRGKLIATLFSLLFIALVAGTLIFGPLYVFQLINNFTVVLALPGVWLRSYLQSKGDKDSAIMRMGLLCFVAGSLWDNLAGLLMPTRVEPYCFAIFLASLGYVAAHSLLRRDQELQDIQSELELARRIQLSILPQSFPPSETFRVEARYEPMTAVAGDLYEYLFNPDRNQDFQAGLLIADVSGHGVPAALIASMVKMAAAAHRTDAADPASLLSAMNIALYGNTQNQFITAAYVHLDAEKREFRYSAAGHPAMLLVRDGTVTEIIENGFVLAMTEGAVFSNAVHALQPDDRLVLYTDGLLEARNEKREIFGETSLHAILRDTAALPIGQAADRIIAAVKQWSAVQDDDLTLLLCDYLG